MEDGNVRDNVLALYEAGTGLGKIARLTKLTKRKVRDILDPSIRKPDAEERLLAEQADIAQQQINAAIEAFVGVERVVSVKLADGCELAWSGIRRKKQHNRRGYEWRLIVRDAEGNVEDVRHLSREERIEIAPACHRLVQLLPS